MTFLIYLRAILNEAGTALHFVVGCALALLAWFLPVPVATSKWMIFWAIIAAPIISLGARRFFTAQSKEGQDKSSAHGLYSTATILRSTLRL